MILAINTSTVQYSMALMQGTGSSLSEYFISSGSQHFRNFMPAFHCMLKNSNSSFQNIRAVIVAIGPGSFTGLRVGLAAAKGMAQGLGIPIIGISSLEAMANQLPHAPYPICPMIDSRKGEVFAALFRWSNDQKMIRIKEDTCLKMHELPFFVEETTLFVGNDFSRQGNVIINLPVQNALLAPGHLWNIRASVVGTLGLKRFSEQDFDDLQELVPLYLRPPDIRPNPYPPIY
jgi:tRNA threonylcarbamoyladenosine biosynthesis protein TsaB